MKKLSNLLYKNKTITWTIAFLLIITGIAMLWLSLFQNVQVIINKNVQEIRSWAITPKGVLRDAGLPISPQDQVIPPSDSLFFTPNRIVVNRSQDVQILNGSEVKTLTSYEKIPANLLQQAGIKFYPHDQILWNGKEVDPSEPIESLAIGALQYKEAIPIKISIKNNEVLIFSSAKTLGAALYESGFDLSPNDYISVDPETLLSMPMEVEIRPARQIIVLFKQQEVSGFTSATTVGEAITDIGISLQDLDYSIPAEDATIPDNGKIEIIDVAESLILTKEEIPYTVSYELDPNTELDQSSVIVPGQVGLIINRSRIRYENGVEVSRTVDSSWQASQPRDGIIGYGTKAVVRTEVVDGVTIEYWRKLSVYATSYSPASQGGIYTGTTITASGMTLKKGIVAVLPSWYRVMKLQPVYIPGYGFGIIADTGGGIEDTPWIDLGYSDDDYVGWHYWVNLYFLTPVPESIPYILP